MIFSKALACAHQHILQLIITEKKHCSQDREANNYHTNVIYFQLINLTNLYYTHLDCGRNRFSIDRFNNITFLDSEYLSIRSFRHLGFNCQIVIPYTHGKKSTFRKPLHTSWTIRPWSMLYIRHNMSTWAGSRSSMALNVIPRWGRAKCLHQIR